MVQFLGGYLSHCLGPGIFKGIFISYAILEVLGLGEGMSSPSALTFYVVQQISYHLYCNKEVNKIPVHTQNIFT